MKLYVCNGFLSLFFPTLNEILMFRMVLFVLHDLELNQTYQQIQVHNENFTQMVINIYLTGQPTAVQGTGHQTVRHFGIPPPNQWPRRENQPDRQNQDQQAVWGEWGRMGWSSRPGGLFHSHTEAGVNQVHPILPDVWAPSTHTIWGQGLNITSQQCKVIYIKVTYI